jgi:membrane fusion protein, multidrug efflux system
MKMPTFPLTLRARRLTVAVAVLALAATLAGGCSRKSSKDARGKKGPVPVLAVQAVEKSVPVQVFAIGNVMPCSKVTIRSQITGQLKEVNFKEGQEVKAGDLLFTIDPRPAQAELEQARASLLRDEAQLENAQINFDRSQKLFDARVMAQGDFDTARATLDSAKGTVAADRAAVTNADLNLGYTTIRAPLDGVTGSQLVYAGNIVKSPDDEMVLINQIHPIYVTFSVPEQHLAEIRSEMRNKPLKVTATYQGLRGPAPAGELTFVDNSVDMTTGTVQLKATFANEDSVLWPGQFVQVELVLAELPHAVVVPSQAIQTGQNGDYVFVMKPDETVEMRPVKIGANHQGDIVVSEGLRTGETVITDGQLNLVNGTKVQNKTAGAATNAVPAQP